MALLQAIYDFLSQLVCWIMTALILIPALLSIAVVWAGRFHAGTASGREIVCMMRLVIATPSWVARRTWRSVEAQQTRGVDLSGGR